ncbi:U3 small nucleolar RNA-associated protein [Serendipita vermifera]|nr:U3 small nucleolar RNA-associated protein [Serendipita vermifera]
MNNDVQLTTSYRKVRTIGPLHTSGPALVTSDAKRIVTCLGEQTILTNVEAGEEICRFYNDTSTVTAMATSPSERYLAVVTASLSLRIYQLPPLYSPPISKPIEPIRHIPKAHDAPVHVVTIDATSNHIATGSADGMVKVWDLHRGYVTHAFRGHGGVISCLRFHISKTEDDTMDPGRIFLATGSVDMRVRIFDLKKSNIQSSNTKPFAMLEGHVSVPRGIAFSQDGKWMLTAGRDSVVLVWNIGNTEKNFFSKSRLSESSIHLAKTIPVSEAIEALAIIEPVPSLIPKPGTNPLQFVIAGEKGFIGIWDAHQGKLLQKLEERVEYETSDAQELRAIQEMIYCPAAASVVAVHADQNIIFHSLQTLSSTRHLIGFNDEIVDATFISTPLTDSQISSDSHLAIATNSSLLRIYSTSPTEGLNSHLLPGHGDIVLALDCSVDGQILVSGSKDKTVRVWSPVRKEGKTFRWECISVGEGHVESVGALAMSRKASGSGLSFLITGSQDRTIKLWDLSRINSNTVQSGSTMTSPYKLQSLVTQKAHEKDVNSLDISPNDALLATGSQDKTANIFEIQYIAGKRATLKLVGSLKGHKRGIWNVKFSKTEKLIATASGDKSVKLWTLDDFSCIKTFEGHTNSVLRVNFINNGQQLLTTASDGLLKLWNIHREDCVATMDNHEDKIWALDITKDEQTVVTAAADSVITFWADSTEMEQKEKDKKKEELVLKEQDLTNYIALQDYKNAIFLALSMDHPRRLYNLFSAVAASRSTPLYEIEETGDMEDILNITGNASVDEVIRTLPPIELAKLLQYVRDWNATAKTSNIAQIILHAIVKLRPAADIQSAFTSQPKIGDNGDLIFTVKNTNDSLRDMVDALIPYTERHLARTDKLVQDSYILDFLLSEMDGGIGEEDDTMRIDGS